MSQQGPFRALYDVILAEYRREFSLLLDDLHREVAHGFGHPITALLNVMIKAQKAYDAGDAQQAGIMLEEGEARLRRLHTKIQEAQLESTLLPAADTLLAVYGHHADILRQQIAREGDQ